MAVSHFNIRGELSLERVDHLEKSIEAVPGVNSAFVDVAQAQAEVQHDNHVDDAQIVSAIQSQGFRCEMVETEAAPFR